MSLQGLDSLPKRDPNHLVIHQEGTAKSQPKRTHATLGVSAKQQEVSQCKNKPGIQELFLPEIKAPKMANKEGTSNPYEAPML